MPIEQLHNLFSHLNLIFFLMVSSWFQSTKQDGYVKISSKDSSESSNAKRKVESLFCVMRKRICRHNSVDDDDMFPDFDYAEESDDDDLPNFMRPKCDLRFENLLDNPYDPLDEGSIVDSDTDLSESSEFFDFISEYVLQVKDLITRSEDVLRCSINKEDPEVPCNSHIFKNDGDKSSAIEVRYGDFVDMQGSMENMCTIDELRLWNKDDEPIPISIVPPDDGWSSISLETCSLHPTVRCMNEYNVDDDNIGLEISRIPLTITLERPSRLLEDSSGACSSWDEQLYLNVSSSEDRDAELAQSPLTLYQDEVDAEDEICFSDIDAMVNPDYSLHKHVTKVSLNV